MKMENPGTCYNVECYGTCISYKIETIVWSRMDQLIDREVEWPLWRIKGMGSGKLLLLGYKVFRKKSSEDGWCAGNVITKSLNTTEYILIIAQESNKLLRILITNTKDLSQKNTWKPATIEASFHTICQYTWKELRVTLKQGNNAATRHYELQIKVQGLEWVSSFRAVGPSGLSITPKYDILFPTFIFTLQNFIVRHYCWSHYRMWQTQAGTSLDVSSLLASFHSSGWFYTCY